MNDETLAAMERAADFLETEAIRACDDADQYEADAALIRALIETLRAGGERAQIVAWLRASVEDGDRDGWHFAITTLAKEIEAGAHVGGE